MLVWDQKPVIVSTINLTLFSQTLFYIRYLLLGFGLGCVWGVGNSVERYKDKSIRKEKKLETDISLVCTGLP